MPNTYQIGRLGRVWLNKESTYGTAPTLVSADAVRTQTAGLNHHKNRADSPERLQHPSQITRFSRRVTADWKLGGLLFPSGTIGTKPEADRIFECGFGAVQAPTPLATTIASGATTTGATLGSGTGLAVGQGILINVTTGSPATGRVVRFLTSVAGAVVTWAPALPQAPGVGDSVKSGVTYNLATALPAGLTIARYLPNVNYEGHGAIVDQLKLTLDANNEIYWEASGPMVERIRPAQAQPAAFTTVGATPPSGISGGMRVGSAAYEFMKAEWTIANAMELDNVAFGTQKGQAFYRKGKRGVDVSVNSMYSSDVTLLAASEGTTAQAILAQCGQTEGSIAALYSPLVEFDIPDDPDNDETMEHAFSGPALGASGNDECYLFLG